MGVAAHQSLEPTSSDCILDRSQSPAKVGIDLGLDSAKGYAIRDCMQNSKVRAKDKVLFARVYSRDVSVFGFDEKPKSMEDVFFKESVHHAMPAPAK